MSSPDWLALLSNCYSELEFGITFSVRPLFSLSKSILLWQKTTNLQQMLNSSWSWHFGCECTHLWTRSIPLHIAQKPYLHSYHFYYIYLKWLLSFTSSALVAFLLSSHFHASWLFHWLCFLSCFSLLFLPQTSPPHCSSFLSLWLVVIVHLDEMKWNTFVESTHGPMRRCGGYKNADCT